MVRWGSPVQSRPRAEKKITVSYRGEFIPRRDFMASSKKKGPVEKIALQCTECKQKNYTTEKNRRNTPNKLELMKYCPFEHKHTLHRETKIK